MGGTGLVGRALVARLVAGGARVLATARTLTAERALREAGAEALHTDIENIGNWSAEAAEADLILHLGLPRLDPPLRAVGARRRARRAAAGARALARLAEGRPVVVASTGLVYGAATPPACDGDPAPGGPLLARAALAAEAELAGPATRVVRLPWIYGESGLVSDLIDGLRARRYRIVGDGDNPWALLSAGDAAEALLAAAAAPPGVYTAAEEEIPTQAEVVGAICAVPGHPYPDHAPPGLAALALGGAMSRALAAPLSIRTGRLAERGWAPRDRWRRDLVSLAGGPRGESAPASP
ncbi:MAG: NAD-dependent epimerase/dehydratase family protein [Thermoleophilia bacterium]